MRRRLNHARNPEDQRVLNKQVTEIQQQISFLRRSVP